MIGLSPQAADLLTEWREAGGIPPDHGIRLDATPAPGGALAVHIGFAPAPEATDEVGESEGTRIFVAQIASAPLADAVIDTAIDDGSQTPQLVLMLPEAP
jgi:Fe-S cluster assembly iron-binding protein IscA